MCGYPRYCSFLALFLVLHIDDISCFAQPAFHPDEHMTVDFESAEIKDVLRAVGATYGFSIVVDPTVSGDVTVHIEDVPIVDGLESIVYGNGFRLEWRDGIAYVGPGNSGEKVNIEVVGGLLTADLSNADVRVVVQEVARNAGFSVILDAGVEGTLTGYISGLPPLAALEGLLRANGFTLRQEGGLYRVRSRGGQGPKAPASYALDISVQDSLVYMDVESADLAGVLREIAMQSGVNLVTYGSVAGEVSARVDSVSVEGALAILLQGSRYSYKRDREIFLIGDASPQSPAAQILSETRLFLLKHVKAEDALAALPAVLPGSQVKAIKEQNALLVTGAQDLHERMTAFLDEFDRPSPQIMIEALIVELSTKASTTLGLRAGLFGSTTGRELLPNMYGELHPEELGPMLEDVARWLRIDSFGKLPDNFTVRIEALESRGEAKIKARPRVVTVSGHEAKINVGWVRWYKTSTGNVDAPITRLHSIDAGISLTIIPWVSASGDVTVELHPMVSNLTGFGPDGLPEIARRTVDTTVRLKDGETVVIGGLIQTAKLEQVERLPVLGHIPFLGRLFSHTIKTEDSSELVIFITPHLVQGDELGGETWQPEEVDSIWPSQEFDQE